MVFITPVKINTDFSYSWTDADVSAYLPAGATGAVLHCHNHGAGAGSIGFRKNGSTDDRYQTLYQGDSHMWCAIGVDENRILELYAWDIDIDVYLVGYYTTDASFFTNAVDKSLASVDSWIDIDISSDTGGDTAIGAIFDVITLNPNYFGLRKNGSTDDRVGLLDRHCGVIIGVDENEICEGQIDNTGVDFFLVGYILNGSAFYTNALEITPSSAGSWVDSQVVPNSLLGVHVEVTAVTGDNYGLRKNGSSEEIYGRPCGDGRAWGLIESDANGIIEVKISNVNNVALFVTGVVGVSGSVVELNYQVSASADDAFEYEGTAGTPAVTGLNLRAGYRSTPETYGNTHCGFRFQNVTIPAGAIIISAKFIYTAQDTDASTDDVALWGEDADSPVEFDTGANSPRDRVATTANVPWTLPNQVDGVEYTSPDISNIIQEIVDRDGWASGNAMVVLIKNNGATENHNIASYDNAGEGAKLKIYYVPVSTDFTQTCSDTVAIAMTIIKNQYSNKTETLSVIESSSVLNAFNKLYSDVLTVTENISHSIQYYLNTAVNAIENISVSPVKKLSAVTTFVDANSSYIEILQQLSSSVNIIGIKICDQYISEIDNAWYGLYTGFYVKAGQSFRGDGKILDSCKFYMSRLGSPTGNAYVKIYAHTGTFGTDGLPTGDALATSEAFDVSTLLQYFDSLITIKFIDANRITLTKDTYYFVVVEYSGGDGSNVLLVSCDITSSTHAGNPALYNTDWVVQSNDMNFYIYTVGDGSAKNILPVISTPVSIAEVKTVKNTFTRTFASTVALVDLTSVIHNIVQELVDAFTISKSLVLRTEKNILNNISIVESTISTITKNIAHSFVVLENLTISMNKIISSVVSLPSTIVFNKQLSCIKNDTVSILHEINRTVSAQLTSLVQVTDNIFYSTLRSIESTISFLESHISNQIKKISSSVNTDDAISEVSEYNKLQSDVLLMSEQLSKSAYISQTDAFEIIDALSSLVYVSQVIADTVDVAEFLIFDMGLKPNDILELVDEYSRISSHSRELADVVDTLDVSSTRPTLVRVDILDFVEYVSSQCNIFLEDDIEVDENSVISTTKKLVSVIVLAETIKKMIGLSSSDSVTFADILLTTNIIYKDVVDSLSIIEVLIKENILTKTEILSLVDTFSKTWQRQYLQQDTFNVIDTSSIQIGFAMSSTVSFVDFLKFSASLNITSELNLSSMILSTIPLSKSDTLEISDSIINRFELYKSDTITISDLLVATYFAKRTFTDTLEISESVSNNTQRLLEDMMTIQEIVSLSCNLSASEILVIEGEINKTENTSVLSDTLSIDEGLTKSIRLYIIDIEDIDDLYSKISVFNLSEVDTLAIVDYCKIDRFQRMKKSKTTLISLNNEKVYLFQHSRNNEKVYLFQNSRNNEKVYLFQNSSK